MIFFFAGSNICFEQSIGMDSVNNLLDQSTIPVSLTSAKGFFADYKSCNKFEATYAEYIVLHWSEFDQKLRSMTKELYKSTEEKILCKGKKMPNY